jgi:SAM-dependent methyltransferase
LCEEYDGDFYDEDYFKKGRQSGKGWLSDYHFMPRRSFREAFAFIDTLNLDDDSYVLDAGCAMGFLVKALRYLEIKADGCDISSYALSFSPKGCWNCTEDNSWNEHSENLYTHIVIKDMLEHLTENQLDKILYNFSKVAPKIMCVIPMGDNGKYRIPEYHIEISHLIAENEEWWMDKFEENGWTIKNYYHHIKGIKDNWVYVPNGNCVFILEKKV